MTNPSHSKARTAGKWEVGKNLLTIVASEHPGRAYVAKINSAVFSSEECEANAAFIVTAVNAHDDLVAALREASELIKSCFGDECAETEEMDALLASLPAPQVRG